MKIYISGKISGDPNYREKFNRAAEELQNEGHLVLNPAILPGGLTARDYMRICFDMIDAADALLLLPGWHLSKGAGLEVTYCEYIGKPYDTDLARLERAVLT